MRQDLIPHPCLGLHPSALAFPVLSTSWQSWIGYFRDQGFDCIDANLDFEPKSGSGSAAPSSSGDDAGKQAAPGKGKGEEHKILADGEFCRP